MQYCTVKSNCSICRTITVIILGVPIFRIFMVIVYVHGVSLRGRRWGVSPSTGALSPAYILEICIGVVWKTYEIPRPPGAKKVNETPVCIYLNQIIINVSEQ